MEELKAKYIGKFLGENKIVDITVTESKTANGSCILDVTFESGKTSLVSEKGMAFVTDEKLDESKLFEAKFNTLSDEYVKVIEDYDIPAYLFDRLGQRITNELRNHLERAFVIKWHGDDSKYSPAFSLADTISFLDVESVNRQFPPKQDAAG